ncbi:hypothetical protein BN140_1087 [Methanoculleus bourgensis MS2]|uniref:DUF4065 domain-containing protein n=1 Tax=Methanoculleus bourgensis (strain ATCC 43281 / DSM 3045 / OCM 15 / MS2) TaxID=1201294 RepID=I7KZ16_METBM|nr:hypothetical protein [Methanoculleus bourgensis]CCJ36010.1 hypothetical protein BN140_1087 [Methanoculleus bourgensis MS2]
MNDRSKVIACFREAGFRMDKDRFEHRLIAQKFVYLMKLKGVEFAYPFRLYVRGPYSPLLAREYYQHADEFSRCETESTLSPTEAEHVAELTALFDKSPSLLEIGATYGYLAYEMHQPPQQAYRTVRRMKSFYSNEQIVKGVNRAKQFLFVPTEEEKAALDAELGEWQRAGIRSMRH